MSSSTSDNEGPSKKYQRNKDKSNKKGDTKKKTAYNKDSSNEEESDAGKGSKNSSRAKKDTQLSVQKKSTIKRETIESDSDSKSEDLKALEKENKDLKNDLRKQKVKLKEAEEKYTELEESLENAAKKSAKEIKKLRNDISNKNDEIKDLETDLEKLRQKCKGTMSGLSNDGDLRDLQEAHAEEMKGMMAELDEAKAEIQDWKHREIEHNEEMENLRRELEKYKENHFEMDTQMNDIDRLKTDLENVQGALFDKVEAVKATLEKVKEPSAGSTHMEKFKNMEMEIENLEDQLRKANDDVFQKTKDCERLEREIDGMKRNSGKRYE